MSNHVRNRLELKNIMERSLKISEEQEDEFKIDRRPKSYIIESNIGKDVNINKNIPLNVSINDTDDSLLKIFKIESEVEHCLFYLDMSDPRFWFLHSVDSSSITDRLIGHLVNYNPSFLDFPWFSSDNLEKISKLGKETGFNLKFDNKFIKKTDESYDNKLQQISMRFWGGHSIKVIQNLKQDNNLKQGIALSALGLKYKTDAGFIKTNISSKGKFVAMKGDSVESYFNLINKVKENYKFLLTNIEENYRINYEHKENGFKLSGGYTIIEFKRKIENIEDFTNILTSCSQPFRLWGIWNLIEKNYIKINGIDLHTNHKINMELTPDWMRIFLPKESCGNVIARLFTNLQNHFDSQIKLRGNDDGKIM